MTKGRKKERREEGKRMKTRFDGIDVARMSSELSNALLSRGASYKVVNIYDDIGGSSRGSDSCYLFKLASTAAAATPTLAATVSESNGVDGAAAGATGMGEMSKVNIVIESGVRFHITKYSNTGGGSGGGSSNMPSPFAMKMRKHIRGLRLEGVKQLGNLDRVVDFKFGSGANSHHVILELYAQVCKRNYPI